MEHDLHAADGDDDHARAVDVGVHDRDLAVGEAQVSPLEEVVDRSRTRGPVVGHDPHEHAMEAIPLPLRHLVADVLPALLARVADDSPDPAIELLRLDRPAHATLRLHLRLDGVDDLGLRGPCLELVRFDRGSGCRRGCVETLVTDDVCDFTGLESQRVSVDVCHVHVPPFG